MGAGSANLWWSQRSLFLTSYNRLSANLNFSTSVSPLQASLCLDEDCDDFLLWLRQKAGAKISSFLSIGKSTHGRCLFASKFIHEGDSILKVPYSVLEPDNLLLKINSLLGNEVDDIVKLSLVIIVEQKLGKDSEWAPYVSRLPHIRDMNSTIFWSDDDLEMIRASCLYQETIKQKAQIEKDFLAINPALQHFPEFFEDVTLKEFKHAYGLDFLNHDGISEADVMSDEGKQLSEVVADRDYAPGDEVLIRYGKFSNCTLLLDFGFTLPSNIYDQVQIEVSMPHHDPLRTMKMDLLHRHFTPAIEDDNNFSTCGNSFIIKEVKSRKGRGIPQSLRAFARVLCCTSPQELDDLAIEAAQTDGRLARQPLKNRNVEFQAHQFLLSKIMQLIEEYNAAIMTLGRPSSPCKYVSKAGRRRPLAQDLLNGELRVLNSATTWLKNYCETLRV